jgi:hypothetical protein
MLLVFIWTRRNQIEQEDEDDDEHEDPPSLRFGAASEDGKIQFQRINLRGTRS